MLKHEQTAAAAEAVRRAYEKDERDRKAVKIAQRFERLDRRVYGGDEHLEAFRGRLLRQLAATDETEAAI